MSRESKSAATIRRRRGKRHFDTFRHKSPAVDENYDFNEEDPELTLETPSIKFALIKLLMSSEKTLFLGLVAFRVINALIIQTSYVPDEYWQSVEVAHKIAYGYGHLTWEWHHGLRGFFYPSIFAVIFKLLGVLHLDNRWLLIKLPRIVQGLFSAIGDLYLFKLSRKLSGQEVAQWTLLCQITSWFTFYCATRTLTNSMEAVFTILGLFYFPWPGKARKAQWKYVTCVGMAVVVRPTAAIVWIPLCAWHIWLYQSQAWRVIKIFAERGFMILSISSILDRVMYGRWEYVHYNFLEFNVLNNMGSFYGSHPWHWYLSQGFAVIMGGHIFPFMAGARKAMEPVLLFTIGWTVFVYSFLDHKEFRFLYPILPMAMHVCGHYLHYLCDEDGAGDAYVNYDSEEELETDVIKDETGKSESSFQWRKKIMITFLVISNLPLALYTSVIHQRGTTDVMTFLHGQSVQGKMDVMTYLNTKTDVQPFKPPELSVMFLMPCHSTPYYSYIHQNISMRFLTCEPNLQGATKYEDEAEVFGQDPTRWLSNEYSISEKLPSHLVMFNVLIPLIQPFLDSHNYRVCAQFFHTHFPEGRVGTHVVVFCSKEMIASQHNYKKYQGLKFH